MIKKLLPLFALVILLPVLIVSCRHSSDFPVLPTVSFNNDVKAILTGNCTQDGCHGAKNSRKFSLVSYDDVMASGIVTAGDAHNSRMFQAITGRSGIMPPASQDPLNDDQIRMIYIWIAQGAKNN